MIFSGILSKKNQLYFENKTIFITGGSSGIGYALAERLLSFAPRTIILLSKEEKKLEHAAQSLRAQTTSVCIETICEDVTNSKSIKTACLDVIARHGAPDILINNAGYAHYNLFHEMSEEEIVRHVDVNLIGAMRVTHGLLPAMRSAKSGQIINICSVAGHMIITPNLVYAAAKHGMVAWSEGLAIELKKDRINVQIISPGRVETNFFDHESFQTRRIGTETQLTVTMKKVINVSINAIVKKKKLVVVPYYWQLIAWILQAFPWFVKPLYNRVLSRRVANLLDYQ